MLERALRQKHCSELCSIVWCCMLSDLPKNSEGLPCEWRRVECFRHAFPFESEMNACFKAMFSTSSMKRTYECRRSETECLTNLSRDQPVEASLFFWRVLRVIEQIENELNRCVPNRIIITELACPDT